MKSNHPCPNCGSPMSKQRGLCAACLLLEAAEDRETEAGSLGSIAGHDLLEVMARGGMGIVYRARRRGGQEVALKALPGASLISQEAHERFSIEAEAMTRLDHPAILPVYQVGKEDGSPFFTMKLARGGSLADRLAEYRGKWKEIAELVARIAEAVHYAHARGVLHRDLKPGNILFNQMGQPLVSDFGLAKLMGSGSNLTQTLTFLGTPCYMAPERTQRKDAATIASDVWSLGVILYELLAGQQPFQGDNLPSVVRAVTESSPAPLPGSVPDDLRVITFKALQKEPSHRYASAHELAADLHRWLEGKPIHARPLSRMEKLGAWVRQNPMVAGLIGIVAISLIATSIISVTARRSVRTSLREALINQAEVIRGTGHIGQRLDALKVLRQAADIRMDPRLVSECAAALARTDAVFTPDWQWKTINVSQFPEFSPDLKTCAIPAKEGGFWLVNATTGKTLRNFPAPAPAQAFAFATDSGSLAVRLKNHRVQIWPLDADKPVAEIPVANVRSLDNGAQATYSTALGAWVVVAEDGSLLKVTPSGVLSTIHPPIGYLPANISASPDGTWLAIVHRGGLDIWSLGSEVRRLWSVSQVAAKEPIAWQPSGQHVAFTASTGIREIIILSLPGAVVRARLRGPIQAPARLAFHPSLFRIAGSAEDGLVHLWDIRDGRLLLQLPAANSTLAWSRDGRNLHCGMAESQIGHYTFTTNSVLKEFDDAFIYGQGAASDLIATRDQRLLLTNSGRHLRFWSTVHRRHLTSFSTEKETLERPAFTPDGRLVAYTLNGERSILVRRSLDLSADGSSLQVGPPVGIPDSEECHILAIQDDGNWLVRRTKTGGLQSWPQGDPARAKTLLAEGTSNTRFSPDGRWAVSVKTEDDGVLIRDTSTPDWQKTLPLTGATSIRWAPNGKWVFIRGAEEHLLLEAGTWSQLQRWPTNGDVHGRKCIAISADSRRLCQASGNDSIQLFSLPDVKRLQQLHPPDGLDFHRAIFSNDGTCLWTMGVGGRVFEWNFTALKEELQSLGIPWQW